MILLDDRIGSKHLGPYFEKQQLPWTLQRLDSADVAFVGRAQGGDRVLVGIEIKTVDEMIGDLLEHRLSGSQLPKLIKTYNPWRWILVEGRCRPNPYSGRLEQPKGKGWVTSRLGKRTITYGAFASYLFTMGIQTQTGILRAQGRPETAALVGTLYRWWDKGWDAHRSLEAIYVKPMPTVEPLEAPSLVRKTACLLDGISWVKSKAVAEAFPTVEAMCAATEAEWMALPGIGSRIARGVVRQLRGEAYG